MRRVTVNVSYINVKKKHNLTLLVFRLCYVFVTQAIFEHEPSKHMLHQNCVTSHALYSKLQNIEIGSVHSLKKIKLRL